MISPLASDVKVTSLNCDIAELASPGTKLEPSHLRACPLVGADVVISTSLKLSIDTVPKSISTSLLEVSSVIVIFAEPAFSFLNCKSSPTLPSKIPTPAVPMLEAVLTSPCPASPATVDKPKAPAVLSHNITLSSSEAPGAEKPTFAKSSKLASAILASDNVLKLDVVAWLEELPIKISPSSKFGTALLLPAP